MQGLSTFYAKAPSSGIWILEYGERFVGIIALDGQAGALDERTKRIGLIRHFHVEEAYWPSNIQADLLEYALRHGFQKGGLDVIETIDSPLLPYKRTSLTQAGFELVKYTATVGVLRWKLALWRIDKETWSARLRST